MLVPVWPGIISSSNAANVSIPETRTGPNDISSNGDQTSVGEGISSRMPSGSDTSLPPGVDPEVFAALPAEVRQEVLRGHGELQNQLPPGHQIDIEVFNSLPADMQQDVILQEQNRLRNSSESSNARSHGPVVPSNSHASPRYLEASHIDQYPTVAKDQFCLQV